LAELCAALEQQKMDLQQVVVGGRMVLEVEGFCCNFSTNPELLPTLYRVAGAAQPVLNKLPMPGQGWQFPKSVLTCSYPGTREMGNGKSNHM